MYLRSILLLILITQISCGTGNENSAGEFAPPLENVLKLELTFGDDESLGEYLLANPVFSPAVDNSGNIYIPDEGKIKVFDSKGSPIKMIGGRGEGPGEFRSIRGITINEYGLITVKDSDKFHLFTPEHEYITRTQFQSNAWHKKIIKEKQFLLRNVQKVFSLDKEKAVFISWYWNLNSNEPKNDFCQIVLILPDSAQLITEYILQEDIKVGGYSYRPGELGSFVYDILPGNRIVYSHFYSNKDDNIVDSQYVLNIKELDTGKKTEIHHPYEHQKINKAPTESYEEMLKDPFTNEEDKKSYREMINKIEERFEDITHYLPLDRIITDNNYIFGFTFEKNEKDEIRTDVFNADTGTFVSSAYFPFIPKVIKNGYAYNLIRGGNEFPTINKYRIDPAVYGK
ncbi:6-bladed beta-propeller [candidate division KSB1 bacterium]